MNSDSFPTVPFRVPAVTVVEVREWDIVSVFGFVRIMGMAHEHVAGCTWQTHRIPCRCLEEPRTSSPAVCPETRERLTRAESFLSMSEGAEIPVHSGKVYRLVGPRKKGGYGLGSIFPAQEEAPTLWARVRKVLTVFS